MWGQTRSSHAVGLEDSVIPAHPCQFGLGLATAIFVDASIVRMILVLATMKLMGDANWWLPNWLDRLLPTIDIEGETGLPPLNTGAPAEPQPVADPDPVLV